MNKKTDEFWLSELPGAFSTFLDVFEGSRSFQEAKKSKMIKEIFLLEFTSKILNNHNSSLITTNLHFFTSHAVGTGPRAIHFTIMHSYYSCHRNNHSGAWPLNHHDLIH